MAEHAKLRQEIAQKVAATVASPDVPVDTTAVPSVTSAVTDAVMDEVAPRIDQITNQEPWWQSRVVLGSLLIIVSRLLAHFGYAIPEELHGDILNLVIAFGPYLGAAVALWGRYARKPFLYKLGLDK